MSMASDPCKDTSEAVARISYYCSDVVLSVRPSLARDSDFSPQLRSLSVRKVPSILSNEVTEVGHQIVLLTYS